MRRARYRWPNEALLCEEWMKLLPDGWTPYPETAGWDILVVRSSDGFQVGVQAKLHPNVKVVAQAIRPWEWERMAAIADPRFPATRRKPGPDVHAVLVPRNADGFGTICRMLNVFVFTLDSPPDRDYRRRPDIRRCDSESWRWDHPSRHELPPYVPDSVAGSPSPITLTKWKVSAIRLCLRLRARGWVTSKDFSELGLSPTYWRQGGSASLLVDSGERDGRSFKWVARAGVRLPDEEHPEVAAKIAAAAEVLK